MGPTTRRFTPRRDDWIDPRDVSPACDKDKSQIDTISVFRTGRSNLYPTKGVTSVLMSEVGKDFHFSIMFEKDVL